VTNDDIVSENEDKAGNILTSLLLTSDLKGYVEDPDYYFADTSAGARRDLDELMLTQGYRHFEWRQVLDTASQATRFQPEKGISIAGQITNFLNKPVARGTVTLLQQNGKLFLNTKTDDKGLFRFTNLVFADSVQFELSAVNASNKNSTKITWFNPVKDAPPVQKTSNTTQAADDERLNVFVENEKAQQHGLIASGKISGVLLKTVNIHSRKSDDLYRTLSFAGAGNADQVMHAAEIEQIGGQLSTSLFGRLRGVRFQNGTPILTQFSPFNTHPMLVIIDGNVLPGDPLPNIDFLDVNSVETVEVLKYASASIYGAAGGNGVLVITTKEGGGVDAADIASVGVLPVKPAGFYKARDFYSPKYDNVTKADKTPDLRSTIYWKPEIKTDANGNASFDFCNSDGTGTYKVTLEGIDSDGNIGRQVFTYQVQ